MCSIIVNAGHNLSYARRIDKVAPTPAVISHNYWQIIASSSWTDSVSAAYLEAMQLPLCINVKNDRFTAAQILITLKLVHDLLV